jgi:hypothetical protein
VVRCVESPHAMAAVRSGQGSLTLCGEKRDLWLPNFLTPSDAARILRAEPHCEALEFETTQSHCRQSNSETLLSRSEGQLVAKHSHASNHKRPFLESKQIADKKKQTSTKRARPQ